MPESRDRLYRHSDALPTFSTRNYNGRGNHVNLIPQDESDEGPSTVTPFRWRGISLTGSPGLLRVRGNFGTPRIRHGHRSSTPTITGQENLSPIVANNRSILPSWYPRLPLRDITAVVRVIERRRAVREESEEGLVVESPILEDQSVRDPCMSTPDARLEHDIIRTRHSLPSIGKVPKILLDITNQKDGSRLTPEKKLLGNIDSVERVVMEELDKLKRTPTAKKVEREKRVRTLMSMR